MGTALYVVIYSRESWWLDFEGTAHGPFDTDQAAIEEGINQAKYSAHAGRASEVLSPDAHGRHRVVWASANERYATR